MTDDDAIGIVRSARVRAARDLRGLTQREVVDLMDTPITTAALSQIESGKVRATPQTLRNLAEALSVPLGFFSVEWPGSGTDEVLTKVTYFRDLAATPAKQRRRAGALTLLLSDLVSAIEAHVLLPEPSVAAYPADASSSRDEIEAIAQAVRGEWDLGESEPIPHVVREIERHGVPVARVAFGAEGVSAFSVRLNNRPLVVLGSEKSHYSRSRFDAAHELGHLIMHEAADPQDRTIESQAHSFAASFLLPNDVAADLLPRRMDGAGWAALAGIKRDYGISMGAMLFRARELNLLSVDRYRGAMKYMSMNGWRTNEPGDRQMGPAESPQLIERALRLAVAGTGLSLETFIDAADLPRVDVLSLVAQSSEGRARLAL